MSRFCTSKARTETWHSTIRSTKKFNSQSTLNCTIWWYRAMALTNTPTGCWNPPRSPKSFLCTRKCILRTGPSWKTTRTISWRQVTSTRTKTTCPWSNRPSESMNFRNCLNISIKIINILRLCWRPKTVPVSFWSMVVTIGWSACVTSSVWDTSSCQSWTIINVGLTRMDTYFRFKILY